MNRLFQPARQTLLSLLFLLFSGQVIGAITPEQRKQLEDLSGRTRKAGELYAGKKYAESASLIGEIQKDLIKLLESKDPALQREARKVFNTLQKAHGLLELEGAELEPLPEWDKLTEGEMKPATPTDAVSFKDDIAPWMISLCGNCHINRTRGQFSLATYNDLMKGSAGGKVIFAGSEQGNRLVEVIETGDMPRGGGKVTDEQLTKLRKWIAQGAKFDGPDPAAALSTIAKGAEMAAPTPAAELKKATGNETVSFARDVAPILVENCNGCHIAARQVSGGLRMDTFTQLLRGGDSGAMITSGDAPSSLLIKKLKGQSGQRMPAGRPALSPEKIELISTWIREGAVFDGSTAGADIKSVVNEAWAADASHEELFTRREERSLANWKKVLPNDEPAIAKNDEFVVLGNVTPARAKEILEQVTRASALVAKQLDGPSQGPLMKGGLTVFVLRSRYDYSEFGRMTEKRELPKEWQGHWHADPLDVYVVIADNPNASEKETAGLMLQMVSGAYLGSHNGVPTWFAEGVARNLVFTANRKSDPRVSEWQRSMPSAMLKIDKPETLIEGKLDEEAAGLAGMAVTGYMMDRANRRRFDNLLTQLRNGKSFNDAATSTFAPPATIIKSWMGTK